MRAFKNSPSSNETMKSATQSDTENICLQSKSWAIIAAANTFQKAKILFWRQTSQFNTVQRENGKCLQTSLCSPCKLRDNFSGMLVQPVDIQAQISMFVHKSLFTNNYFKTRQKTTLGWQLWLFCSPPVLFMLKQTTVLKHDWPCGL